MSMIKMFPHYQSDSSTYYSEAVAAEGSTAYIGIPAAVGAMTFDIHTTGISRYSIYVTASPRDQAESEGAEVVWHPTEFIDMDKDLFVVMSGVVGAYKIVCTTGNISIKVRGK